MPDSRVLQRSNGSIEDLPVSAVQNSSIPAGFDAKCPKSFDDGRH